jgi:hypothetical protein
MPSKKLTKKAVTTKSRASASKSVEKYDHVDFLVVSETRVDHYPGTVIIRSKGEEMVLEIRAGPPYLLPGRITSGIYNAIESHAPTGSDPVRARWTRLGPYYVGTWIERGMDNLFRFRLPAET